MSNIKLILNKNKKRLILVLISVGLLSGFLAYIYNKPAKLEVDFLDVGQGDSALIKTPAGQVILIDGGPDNLVLRRLGENLPFYRRQIDLIILSHYHDDHVTGLVEVLKRYRVKTLIYGNDGFSSLAYQALLAAAVAKRVNNYPLSSEVVMNLGADCSLKILNPVALKIAKNANNSLVAKLNCQGRSFLFAGDNDLKVEQALIRTGLDWQADVFKTSHHGSNSANSEDWLRAVSPQKIIISVGLDNKFGHPAPLILQRFIDLGLVAYRTDKLGTIRFISQ